MPKKGIFGGFRRDAPMPSPPPDGIGAPMPSGGGDGLAALAGFFVQKIVAWHRRPFWHRRSAMPKNADPDIDDAMATPKIGDGRKPKNGFPSASDSASPYCRRASPNCRWHRRADAIAAAMHGDGGRCHRRYDHDQKNY
jgi:hypothetical protein